MCASNTWCISIMLNRKWKQTWTNISNRAELIYIWYLCLSRCACEAVHLHFMFLNRIIIAFRTVIHSQFELKHLIPYPKFCKGKSVRYRNRFVEKICAAKNVSQFSIIGGQISWARKSQCRDMLWKFNESSRRNLRTINCIMRSGYREKWQGIWTDVGWSG